MIYKARHETPILLKWDMSPSDHCWDYYPGTLSSSSSYCNIFEDCIPVDETWWRHQMETFSALLAFCVGNSPATGEFPSQRPVMWSFDVFFDLRLNRRLSKQWWGWWFETPSHPLWCHCNETTGIRSSNKLWWWTEGGRIQALAVTRLYAQETTESRWLTSVIVATCPLSNEFRYFDTLWKHLF